MTEKARFFMTSPNSPIVEMKGTIPLAAKDWFRLISELYSSAVNGGSQPESAITVTASPFTYTGMIRGQLSVVGGGGLTIEFSRNGTSFYAAGTAPCMIPLCKGDRIRIAYAVAPAVTFFPM